MTSYLGFPNKLSQLRSDTDYGSIPITDRYLGICVPLPGKNISLGICVPLTWKEISLGICVPLTGKHISLGICVPPPENKYH